ncbi:MAG: LysM peptidoglycan-binding domain-containing protein [Rickettsiales bacterium]|nr:LysM peptidoglycan-binding domain-containing protein [Rickettsiales bacterium]
MLNKFLFLFLSFFLFTCSQSKFADIVYKNKNIIQGDGGDYIESPDGKIAKSLRSKNVNTDSTISIIKDSNDIKTNIGNDNSGSGDYHVVERGDSLWSISRQYEMTLDEIAKLNNLTTPYKVKIGQKIKINGKISNKSIADSSSSDVVDRERPLATTTYTVKKGDVLSRIADKFNISSSEIIKLNKLKKPYKIKVGQKLKIRGSSANKNEVKQVVEKKDNKKETENKKVEDTKTLNAISNKNNKFMWPIKGNIVSSFGGKKNGLFNDGINISAPQGSSFVATEDGTVAYVGNELRGYGIIILIKHSGGWISVYAHCDSVKVSKGDSVKKGQVIGSVGQSGNVHFPQLYFSLRKGREPVNPLKYF